MVIIYLSKSSKYWLHLTLKYPSFNYIHTSYGYKNVRRTFTDLFSDIASLRGVIKRRKKRGEMSAWLGVLPLQPEAQLADHGLVVRPLPVVDDQPAGAAGEQAVAQGEITETTTSSGRVRWTLETSGITTMQ